MQRIKKRLLESISSLKLSTKVTFLVVLFMLVPAFGIATLSFSTIHRNLIRDETEHVRMMLYESLSNTQRVVDSCLATSQVVIEDTRLVVQLEQFLSGNTPSDAMVRSMRENHILPMGRLAQANSDLYWVRLYAQNERAPEISPSLLHMDRLRKQTWYTKPLPARNTWKYNYVDKALDSQETSPRLAALLNEVRDKDNRLLGILEVSVPMDNLFHNMYAMEEPYWMGFVDSTGTLHYDRANVSSDWKQVIGSVVYAVADGSRVYTSTVLTQGRHTVLASSVPVPQLSGRIIWAVMLDDDLRAINQQRFLIYASLFLFNLMCILVIHWAVKKMLGRFYKLTDISRELQRGNLNVDVPPMGHDEIGEFATIFRETIARLKDLLETSVEREMLVKTTEIRALQNQINSHFIYNVLEAIKMMAEIDEEYDISDAVTSLGKLLRYSMKWVSSMVTLRDELDYIHHYIALLNLRYDYTITLSLQIPEELMDRKLPKMSLQPIVENAAYHGIEGLEADAVIRIHAVAYEDCFEVEITDSGRGMGQEALSRLRRQVYGEIREDPKRSGGIGLRNVQNRIQLSFGSGYGLRFYTQEGCYMKVIVKLPLDS